MARKKLLQTPEFLAVEDNLSLLMFYINDKADHYVEPMRKGTPRGEPVGLSYQKYLTTCLTLLNKPLKSIARTARVSYGLLRKWRTEKSYIDAVQHHAQEFIRSSLLPALRNIEKHRIAGDADDEDLWMREDANDPSVYSGVITSAILELVTSGVISEKDIALLRTFVLRQLLATDLSSRATRAERRRWLDFVVQALLLILRPPAINPNDDARVDSLLRKAQVVIRET
jgi:hypothetical protein